MAKKYYESTELQNFYGSKNLVEIANRTETINGVTFSVDENAGTVTLNGTSGSSGIRYNIATLLKPFMEIGKTYILTGSPSGAANSKYCLRIQGPGIDLQDEGSGVSFTVPNSTFVSTSYQVFIYIWPNITCSNLVFKPMLRLKDTDDTFVPFAPTNKYIYNRTPNIPGRQTGRDLTARLSTTLYDEISAGDFSNIKPGDRIVGPTTGMVYWVAHRDLWYGYVQIGLINVHHVILWPAQNLSSGPMNETNTTEGGYYNSKGRETVANLIEQYFVADFGSHIKTYKDLLSNATSDGLASGWGWYDVKGSLLSETDIYGAPQFGDGRFNTGTHKEQLEIFRDLGTHIYGNSYFWLRDVVTAAWFALAGNGGDASVYAASVSGGFRPLAVLAA